MSASTFKPLDFINTYACGHFSECGCVSFMRRDSTDNARDFIDRYIVDHFIAMGWPKDRPIQVLDVIAGKLLQTLTIVTSLVSAGFQIHLCVIDDCYAEESQSKYADPSSKQHKDYLATQARLIHLQQMLTKLNKSVGNANAIQLIGIFSHIDSYLATREGKAPLTYQVLPQKEVRRLVEAGNKRRYLITDVGPPDNPIYHLKNSQFAKEFKEGSLCVGTIPDLILTIDDVTEFFPLVTGISEYRKFPEKNQDYAYQAEIFEPLRILNPNAIFIVTRKYDRYFDPKIDVICIDHGDERTLLRYESDIKKVTQCEYNPPFPYVPATEFSPSYLKIKKLIQDIADSLIESDSGLQTEMKVCGAKIRGTLERQIKEYEEKKDFTRAEFSLFTTLRNKRSDLAQFLADKCTYKTGKGNGYSHVLTELNKTRKRF